MARFSTGYVFGFATAVCVVCSVAVAGVSMSLRERQDLNRQRDIRSSILGALGLPADLEGEAIDATWDEKVEQRFITPEGTPAGIDLDLDGDGALDDDDLELAMDAVKNDDGGTPPLLGVYTRMEGSQVRAVAIPLDGNGLWGPLSGYIALDPQGRQVTGATFFAPKETPGLGAEIQETPFEQQWIGKDVTGEGDDTVPIRVVKGKAANLCADDLEHCVDGVSGATITSRGVDEMVAEALEWYDPFLSSLRQPQ